RRDARMVGSRDFDNQDRAGMAVDTDFAEDAEDDDAAETPPGVPSPGVPSPGVPSPGVPSPGVPSPGVPSPGASPPPPAAAVVFGPALDEACAFAGMLATRGVEWGLIGPYEVPRLWDRHLLNCAGVADLVGSRYRA